jgi:hypothetical protein
MFTTVDLGLFIANFSGNYSHLTFTVTDSKNVVQCTMIYAASLNEAICSLRMVLDTQQLILYGKKNGTVVIKHIFVRTIFNPDVSSNVLTTYNDAV